ncbi:MAG: hypothetical protein DRP09_15215 [Candidatus Thorarchaeota archaeon]|nr:MAG: hypothetical protein DRP09_15215 [Candidatus Thorarchaeota archaeon]
MAGFGVTGNSAGSSEATLVDILKAIRTIKTFVDFREKLNELMSSLASAGIDISRVNWNNPMSIMNALSMAQKRGVDIDVDTLIDELSNSEEIKLSEVEEAVDVLRRYYRTSMRIDSVLRTVARSKTATMGELEDVMSMFGFKVPRRKIDEVVDEIDEEIELTDEEIEEMRKIIESRRKSGKQ